MGPSFLIFHDAVENALMKNGVNRREFHDLVRSMECGIPMAIHPPASLPQIVLPQVTAFAIGMISRTLQLSLMQALLY
jgi:hypothetical protein